MVTTLGGRIKLFCSAALLVVLAACGSAGPGAGAGPNDGQANKVEVVLNTFSVTPSVNTVKAGPVTFEAVNKSGLTHEMLAVRVRDLDPNLADDRIASVGQAVASPGEGPAEEQLVNQLMGEAYDRVTSRLTEEKINSIGEVADIGGGTGGSVVLDLPPGEYLLLCNITAHFQSGMHARLIIKP